MKFPAARFWLLAVRFFPYRYCIVFCTTPLAVYYFLHAAHYSLLAAYRWTFAPRSSRRVITVRFKLFAVRLASSFSLLASQFFPPAAGWSLLALHCSLLAVQRLASLTLFLAARSCLFDVCCPRRSSVLAAQIILLAASCSAACLSLLYALNSLFAALCSKLAITTRYWPLTVYLSSSLLADNPPLFAYSLSPLAGGYLNLASCHSLHHHSICTFAFSIYFTNFFLKVWI